MAGAWWRISMRAVVLSAGVSLLLPSAILLAVLTTRVSAASTTITLQIATAADDARSPDTGGYTSSETTMLVGAGNGRNANVVGYRFSNVQIPRGAIIDTVTFTLVKNGAAWQRFVVTLAFEASNDAAPFTASAQPHARPRTSATASIDSNVRWTHDTAYALGSATALAASLQQVIDRPGWQPGNSIALIAYGPPTPAYARLAFFAFGAGASRAPRLSVTYHVAGDASATTTSTTTAPPPATATFTPIATATSTATATPTPVPPTATATATSNGSTDARNIRVGPGFSDVSPHQLVRTSNGDVYIIVPTCDSYPSCPSNRLVVYRGNQTGTPTIFAAVAVPNPPSGGIGSSAIAIDGQDNIHVVWNDRVGRVNYAVFDTRADAWGPTTILDQTNWTTFGQGDQGVGLALDATAVPHVVWNVRDGSGRLRIRYAHRGGGVWSSPLDVDDVPLAPNHNAWHPTIAFAPDGTLWLSWLDGTFNYTPDGVIRVRSRSAGGQWVASTTIPDTAMTGIDNGPSLLITPDGVVHLTFLNTQNVVRYWRHNGAGWNGDQQPAQQVTHNPSLGPDGAGGIYIYGHGAPVGSIGGHGDNLYRFHLPAGGAWSAWTLYVSGAYDSSVGVRWAQFFHTAPTQLDVIYWADPYPNILYFGTEQVGGPTPLPTPTPTSTPTATPTTSSSPALLVGIQQIQPQQDHNQAGMAEAFQYTAVGGGDVNWLSIYLDPSSSATRVVIGLYSDAGNRPGTLLTHGTISSPMAGAWNTVAVPEATVAAGDRYWIAVLGPVGAGTVQFRDAPSGGPAETSAETTLTALPVTWTTGTRYNHAPMSAYASGQ